MKSFITTIISFNILLLICATNHCHAQTDNNESYSDVDISNSLEKSVLTLNLAMTGITYEHKITNQSTINASTKLFPSYIFNLMGLNIPLFQEVSAQYRYYFDVPGRTAKGKVIENNSFSFLGIRPAALIIHDEGREHIDYIQFTMGIQRSKNNWQFHLEGGVASYNTISLGNMIITPTLYFSFGYVIN